MQQGAKKPSVDGTTMPCFGVGMDESVYACRVLILAQPRTVGTEMPYRNKKGEGEILPESYLRMPGARCCSSSSSSC